MRLQEREMGSNVKSIVVKIQHCYQNMTTVISENDGNNVICAINCAAACEIKYEFLDNIKTL